MHPILLAAILTLPASQPSTPAAQGSTQTPPAQIRELKGRVVERFPKVPIFQGAKVERSYVKKEPGKVGYEATWTVNAPVSKVVAWYRRELPRLGWKILEYNEGDDEQNLLIQRDGRKAFLWIERTGKVTEITVEFPMTQEVPQ
jgi:hypothetical protein